VAQVPVQGIQGISEIADIHPKTFYNRVDWIYERVQAYFI